MAVAMQVYLNSDGYSHIAMHVAYKSKKNQSIVRYWWWNIDEGTWEVRGKGGRQWIYFEIESIRKKNYLNKSLTNYLKNESDLNQT